MPAPTAAWRPGSDPASPPQSAPGPDRASTRKFRFGASPRPDTEPALCAGVLVGERYRVESLIGEGGMGRVYRARHVFLDRPVAIKVLRREARTDPDSVQRFQREALAASKVGHAGIVQVSDFAKMADGQVFLAMELLEGESLEQFMERPSSLDEALAVLQQTAEGLAAAHAAGVIHRDIKPANIFLARLGDGATAGDRAATQAKILDFGIAKMATERVGGYTTSNGAVLGTPYYLAPERARGDEPDPRADIYSLGVILYELLTGTLPFVADNFMAILGHHMRTPPVDPRLAAPDRPVPDEVAQLCMSMLEKRPEARPADAGVVARRLAEIRAQLGPSLAAVATGPRSGVASADADTQALQVPGATTPGVALPRDTAALERPSTPPGPAPTGPGEARDPDAAHPDPVSSPRRLGIIVAVAMAAGAAAGLVALELGAFGGASAGDAGAEAPAVEATGAEPTGTEAAGAKREPGRGVPAAGPSGPREPASAAPTPAPVESAAPGDDAPARGVDGTADRGAPSPPVADDDGTKETTKARKRTRHGRGPATKANPVTPPADREATESPPASDPSPDKSDGTTPPELKDDIYGD